MPAPGHEYSQETLSQSHLVLNGCGDLNVWSNHSVNQLVGEIPLTHLGQESANMDVLSDQQVEGFATVLHTGLKHNKREQGTLVAFTNRVLQPAQKMYEYIGWFS